MELRIDDTAKIPLIITTHGDQRLEWNGRQYLRRGLGESVDVVTHINDYWATKSQAVQSRIFELYRQAHDALNNIADPYALIMALRPIVEQFFESHTSDQLRHWYTYTEKTIYIPSDLELTFKKDVNTGAKTRERTYTRDDYIGLALLVMQLRPLIPIWGEMATKVSDPVRTNYKEYTAFQALASSDVMQSPSMEKLLLYITHTINSQPRTAAIAVGGLGTEELPQLVLGSVLVNRICVGDLYARPASEGGTSTYNLVVAAYKAALSCFNTANQSGAAISDQVKTKAPASGDGTSDEASTMEGFKIKQLHPASTRAPYVIFTEDSHGFCQKLDPHLDHGLYQHFLHNMRGLRHFIPNEGQLLLTQYVVGHIVPPEIFPHMEIGQIVNSVALAQTWLWHRQHQQLAALIGAVPAAMSEHHESSLMFSGSGTLQKLHTEFKDQLLALYPYARQTRARSRGKAQSMILQAVDQTAQRFNAHDWIVCLPDVLATQMFQRAGASTRIACPAEIRSLIAAAIIDVAKTLHQAEPVAA